MVEDCELNAQAIRSSAMCPTPHFAPQPISPQGGNGQLAHTNNPLSDGYGRYSERKALGCPTCADEIERLRAELARKTAEATAFFDAGVTMRQKALDEAAAVCDAEAKNPSTLWEEPGCWTHAAENCASAIRTMRKISPKDTP